MKGLQFLLCFRDEDNLYRKHNAVMTAQYDAIFRRVVTHAGEVGKSGKKLLEAIDVQDLSCNLISAF